MIICENGITIYRPNGGFFLSLHSQLNSVVDKNNRDSCEIMTSADVFL